MTKMQEEYDQILKLDYDEPFRIPCSTADALILKAERRCEKLDGMWNFSIDVFDTYLRKKFFEEIDTDAQGRKRPVDYSFDAWEKTAVPSNWNMQNAKYHYYEGTAIYTRKFDYQPREPHERVFLRVGAANYESRMWINGVLVGRHQGGFTPFCVEITQHLKPENRIVITVNNARRAEQVPSLNYDWFNYGGIFRSVELMRLPQMFIKDFFTALKPDKTYKTVMMQMQLSEEKQGVECRFQIEELAIDKTAITNEKGIASIEVNCEPVLWCCETPKLYKVCVSCARDALSDTVGLREIRVQGKEILLNGTSLFLKGVCCHEESQKNGRALTEDERIAVLKTARELGCNMLRLSHYPHSERMAQLADEMGMLLWEEIPVYWALDFENIQTFENAANQMRELILRDRNRASVVVWSIGNENPDSDARLSFMTALAKICRELDYTRPISAACLVDIDEMRVKDRLADVVDIVAFNEYYGWYYRDYEGLQVILNNTNQSKPLIISETGAGALPGNFGPDEELFTEEHQAKLYEKQFSMLGDKIQGTFPWILFDFRSPVRMNAMQNQHNLKGLVDVKHVYRKLAFETIKNFYSTK